MSDRIHYPLIQDEFVFNPFQWAENKFDPTSLDGGDGRYRLDSTNISHIGDASMSGTTQTSTFNALNQALPNPPGLPHEQILAPLSINQPIEQPRGSQSCENTHNQVRPHNGFDISQALSNRYSNTATERLI